MNCYDTFKGNVKINLEKLDNLIMPYKMSILYDDVIVASCGFTNYENALDRVKLEHEREACRLAYLMDRSVVESCKIG